MNLFVLDYRSMEQKYQDTFDVYFSEQIEIRINTKDYNLSKN